MPTVTKIASGQLIEKVSALIRQQRQTLISKGLADYENIEIVRDGADVRFRAKYFELEISNDETIYMVSKDKQVPQMWINDLLFYIAALTKLTPLQGKGMSRLVPKPVVNQKLVDLSDRIAKILRGSQGLLHNSDWMDITPPTGRIVDFRTANLRVGFDDETIYPLSKAYFLKVEDINELLKYIGAMTGLAPTISDRIREYGHPSELAPIFRELADLWALVFEDLLETLPNTNETRMYVRDNILVSIDEVIRAAARSLYVYAAMVDAEAAEAPYQSFLNRIQERQSGMVGGLATSVEMIEMATERVKLAFAKPLYVCPPGAPFYPQLGYHVPTMMDQVSALIALAVKVVYFRAPDDAARMFTAEQLENYKHPGPGTLDWMEK